MSISKKLDETLQDLDLDSSAKELKDRAISKSMNTFKEGMSKLDINIERQTPEEVKQEPTPRYDKMELADQARQVYRENINPAKKKDKTVDQVWAEIDNGTIKIIEKNPLEDLSQIRRFQADIKRGIRTPQQILETFKDEKHETLKADEADEWSGE